MGTTFRDVNVSNSSVLDGAAAAARAEAALAQFAVQRPANTEALRTPAFDEIAKQILTILSTILAAMIGFYFGAKPGESAGPRPDQSAPQPQKPDDKAALHPYADLAGFGAAEGRILEETGALLAPLASGVVSLAYSYLLSRPESAGYFQDAHHLAQRKETLMAWWVRTASDPYETNSEFGTYLRRVANAHVKNAGMYPDVGIPAQLTIALMGWVEMRVMTAINTINIVDGGASAIFGLFGDPAVIARVGRAWMSMLTLQLGVLIDPHCFPGALSREPSTSSPLP